jgi:hypothetical protein
MGFEENDMRAERPVAVEIVHIRQGAFARIHLNGGRYATLDLADLPRVAAFRWYANYSDGR